MELPLSAKSRPRIIQFGVHIADGRKRTAVVYLPGGRSPANYLATYTC